MVSKQQYQVLLFCCTHLLFFFFIAAEKKCGSPLVLTCQECLSRGPECAWCFQKSFLDGTHISERCDSAAQLMLKGCKEEFIENPGVKVEVNMTQSGSQVIPRDISIQLRPGNEASFVVEVKQLELYPVDLYYLVDVSASMQENLDQLKTIGVNLSHRMKEHSSDFQVGFGSFVDKPVSPYIDVHPSKIINPCSDYEINCRPAHGFINVLPITNNMTKFKHVIQQQRISGNMDTPEGGFDAMLQAAVCQKDIGWRPEAKHLLLVMTDQPSHLALDSKLAGIVVPHDGHCHLNDGEHPTIGQLAEKLLKNSIYSIFAVNQMQYKWYEDLVALVPGSYLGKLLPKASDLTNLVVDAYKKLLSEVGVEVEVEDSKAHRFWVSVTALCPTGSTSAGSTKCTNVQPGQKVFFNITVGMRACPEKTDALQNEHDSEVMMVVKPVGFNESTIVRVQQACMCSCGRVGPCHDEPETSHCASGADQEAGRSLTDSCRDVKTGLVCSGRGTCVCGACVCDRSNLGIIYGRLCEKDGNAHVILVGQERVVAVPSPKKAAGQPMAWCVAGKENVSVASVCVITSDALEHSVRSVPPARTPVSHTGIVWTATCLKVSQQNARNNATAAALHWWQCVSCYRYFKTFLSVFLLTVVLGLGILAVVRLLLRGKKWSVRGHVIEQFDENSKNPSYVPTHSEKTITYRRDCFPEYPMEHIRVHKMPLHDIFP
ncbi:Integrin beta-8 [Bagarius yarrelli]|uniref:Integrin beta n=1 Tax=Bagarius yarrelli TaxID=175774 RepID=A0A556UEY5_BAGYA|nr:Integrin beta-8 [Bagarius yarrelli]